MDTLELIPGYQILEKLNESYPHTVFLAMRRHDNCRVAIKTLSDRYPQKEHLAGLQREFRIMKDLGLEHVVRVYDLIGYGQGNLAMIMEPFGISLANYLRGLGNQKLTIDRFLDIAIPLVETCREIHEKMIIHKGLHPANMLIDPETGTLKLIDFSAASELSREHIEGNAVSNWNEKFLPYISPEQTGRINRDIDFRSDFYALGVSFFEMLTGKLPFQAKDPLEWVHCAISRQPPPALQINPELPKVISDMLGKLMAKNAEERYQSSYGILADLKKLREQWNKGWKDVSFEIAQSDVSRHFRIPQKLYGREQEIQKLEWCFENAYQGAVEFCLVSGYSGIGKTSLVNELGKPIISKNGYLIQGKFEQFRQNTPYAALAFAFQALVRQILGESKSQLEAWKNKIQAALGNNGQLITDLIPDLALIIGKQPPVQELSPAENQNRFLLQFINFVKVFAQHEHPLVIFMDDLQWSDVPTLNLINRLVTSHDLGHILLIGAFRDNEIDQTHPLSLTLREIQSKRPIEQLLLKPLSPEATDQLTQDTLLSGPGKSQELSRILYEKTGGNPFFTIEMLKNLQQRGKIFFDATNGIWNWDIQAVKQVNFSDNVIDILVANQDQLDTATQHALQLASCIGNTFDLKTLSLICETSMEATGAALSEALKSNMVMPLNESYKYAISDQSINTDALNLFSEEINPWYRFQHDRVQQASYSCIDPQKRTALHLLIGRQMLNNRSEEQSEEELLDIVRHLNEGRPLIKERSELDQLAGLNLAAAVRAKQSSAYDAALQYLKTGYELLGDEAWVQSYELSWKLNHELQNCFYLTGQWDSADGWTDLLIEQSSTDIEKSMVLSDRARQYATTGRMKESLEAAFKGLGLLGFNFTMEPSADHVAEEVRKIEEQLNGRAISDLIHMPEMTDERSKIASQLIMEIFPAAFLSASGVMFPYIVLKSVNISLHSGNSPESAFAYTAYGMLLCGYFDDPGKGSEYGKLGVNMIERLENIALKSRIIYVYAMFIHHWSNHWSSMTPWFRKGIDAGYLSGDLLYLAYSAQDCIIWDPKLDLETASQEHRKLLDIVRECEYQDSLDSGTLFLQMQLNFQGLTNGLYEMSDQEFDEDRCVQGMLQRRFMTGISNYHIYKAEIHLLYNDAKGALEHVLEQEKRMASVIALPQAVRFHIVSFLVRSMLLPQAHESEQKEYLEHMQASLVRMTAWARHCKENFEHLRLLMNAELSAYAGNLTEALQLYEQAIASARKSGFMRDEAMAAEMMAKTLLSLDLNRAGSIYIQDAYHLYDRWGAHRKVEHMEKQYSFLNISDLKKNRSAKGRQAGSSFSNTEFLDISSVLKASQTISGELVLDKLLTETLSILMENAGAQKGSIIEYKDGNLNVQMQRFAEGTDTESSSSKSVEHSFPFPVTLINTAIRTQAPVVLENASEPNAFSMDPYIRTYKPVSVMCVPLPLHGNSASAVYFENNLTQSAFTRERVEIVKLLASQASISLENARIYEKQEKLLKAQQLFVPSQFLRHLGHTDISNVKLGDSVVMEMSILFSDIRNFTPLVERLSPQAVIELLNVFYSDLAVPITTAGGFIDSYAGDGIMALFAVPAEKAIEAGIGMSKKLGAFNQNSGDASRPPIKIGIGINTGPVVLGTMGANDRMQCSVLGDSVNLASRIEQLTRLYDAQCIIGEQTYEAIKNSQVYTIRLIDRVAVKGKGVAVKLYEVVDAETDERRKLKSATLELLANAQEAYYARRFHDAASLFEEGKTMDPDDPVFAIFLDRCKHYIDHPPPEDWQGFEKLERK